MGSLPLPARLPPPPHKILLVHLDIHKAHIHHVYTGNVYLYILYLAASFFPHSPSFYPSSAYESLSFFVL